MTRLLFSLFALLFTVGVFAQRIADPQAKAILDKMKVRYESYATLGADFTLLLDIPGEDLITQKGQLRQDGDKFRLDLEEQAIISNGETVWLYLKNNQEVQINDAEFDEEAADAFMSPKDLLQIYERGDMDYALTNEMPVNGRVVQQVEFKPLDREESEYSKLRLTVDKKTLDIVSVVAFGKDGSRYTFELDALRPNERYTATDFEWQTSECPDCYVEDLRID